MLVGNKSDLRHLRAVPTDEAKAFAGVLLRRCWQFPRILSPCHVSFLPPCADPRFPVCRQTRTAFPSLRPLRSTLPMSRRPLRTSSQVGWRHTRRPLRRLRLAGAVAHLAVRRLPASRLVLDIYRIVSQKHAEPAPSKPDTLQVGAAVEAAPRHSLARHSLARHNPARHSPARHSPALTVAPFPRLSPSSGQAHAGFPAQQRQMWMLVERTGAVVQSPPLACSLDIQPPGCFFFIFPSLLAAAPCCGP